MKHFLLIALFFISQVALAQTEDEDYSTEITWGLNKNTNGGLIGGVIFKIARQKKDNLYSVFGIELMNVKHRKEFRHFAPTSGTSFIWGKEHFLYSVRSRFGLESVLFRKAPQQGVQISAIAAGGPTIGVLAPYYILTGGTYEPFDPDVHSSISNVQGSGKLFQGLSESEIVPGVNAKLGLSFEFGTFKNSVAGIEVGVSAEAFTKKIILVPTEDNSFLFSALYFNLYWGTRK